MYTNDPHATIIQVSNLAPEHPAEVSKLLDAATALDAVGHFPPSWNGITDPAKVEKVILAQAQHNAVSGEAFSKAKEQAAGRIRAELTRAVAANQTFYLEQREEKFEALAQAYLAAVEKLPDHEFGPEDVIAFDPETFEAYTQAKTAAAGLRGTRSWLQGFASVSRSIGLDSQQWSPNFLILEPKDVLSYSAIQMQPEASKEPAYQAIAPELVHAIKNGAGFKLSTGTEANGTAQRFESQRQELGQAQWTELRRQLIR